MKIMIIFERFVVLISEPVLLFSTISALSSAKVDFVTLCTAHTFFFRQVNWSKSPKLFWHKFTNAINLPINAFFQQQTALHTPKLVWFFFIL